MVVFNNYLETDELRALTIKTKNSIHILLSFVHGRYIYIILCKQSIKAM